MIHAKRRQFLMATGALLASPHTGRAQQARKVPRVGYLSWTPPSVQKMLTAAFLEGMREHGYVDGQSVAIDYRRGTGDQLPELAAELVRLKVDVIVALGTPAARVAKQTTSTIPIVITLVSDPVDSGVVPNLARPGGNVTGLSLLAPEVWAKALELLMQTVPGVSRVAVLIDPTNAGHVTSMKTIDAASKVLGVKVQRIHVQTRADLDRALATDPERRADAFYVFPLRITATDWQKIIKFAINNRVPTLVSNTAHVASGALMSYGVNFANEVRRTGVYIDRILKGAKPADLPVERPIKFDLVVNVKTAKAIGITIPQSIMLRADRVIE